MAVRPLKSPPLKAAASKFGRKLAVTFDDVPLQPSPPGNETLPDFETLRGINGRLLDKLKKHGIPAVGFVNEKRLHFYDKVSARISLLKMWLDAGLELGNHTFSHATPETTSLGAYLDDIMRGEELTRPLLREHGQRLRYFRHPELHTGVNLEYKTALEQFLEARGYTIAPVTIKHQGWVYAVIYAVATGHGDVELMRRVAAAYLSYMETCFEFFEQLSITVLGYEVRQILLLHANELNTDHLNDVVEMIKDRGYVFVTLEHALEDRAYLLSDGYAGPKGPSWLHRWGYTMGLELPGEPREPEFIKELYRSATGGSRG